MITHISEWIFEVIPSEPTDIVRLQKRHTLPGHRSKSIHTRITGIYTNTTRRD
ncbi:hypothetical protein ZYGR_0AZ00830 [Zygosaccharomyces rouxii]|uniref:Uncharacterized protein n=1 Tax=Zygosaccharomyces rouxii TaxID=4956 RepID=A0A1Q3AK11_ZYGRO|nr:hypothetical protein ZYGR_0AZ00830 [Zygosaccharomyces rouxii]